MNQTLVVGGGLAGCSAALELADNGLSVTIVEKSNKIGGKVRNYGCKATTDRCNNCGLCLVGDLWERVENHDKIKVMTETQLKDVNGPKGNFSVTVATKNGTQTMDNVNSIIVSIGFNEFSSVSSGCLEYEEGDNVIGGYDLEKLLAARSKKGVLPRKPESIAFIQCFGSRDIQEKALYCSRVCCGYSTRAARVLKQYYGEAKITFFYMDLQRVEEGSYFDTLTDEGIEFIRCRPVKIVNGNPCRVVYEQPGTNSIIEKEFDIIVLTEGIHPPMDAERIAELCMLEIDDNGFLRYISNAETDGVYLAGCASGPKRIEEVHAEALTTARKLIANIK
jgi:heterodisulfide reductase subunit A